MDKQWDKWKAEQVQTITQILTNVFKVEDEARHMQEPSRLLRRSSLNIPQAEAEIRNKLNQIRKQIIEYEDILELGLKRVDKALEKIDPPKRASPSSSNLKNSSLLLKLLSKIKSLFYS